MQLQQQINGKETSQMQSTIQITMTSQFISLELMQLRTIPPNSNFNNRFEVRKTSICWCAALFPKCIIYIFHHPSKITQIELYFQGLVIYNRAITHLLLVFPILICAPYGKIFFTVPSKSVPSRRYAFSCTSFHTAPKNFQQDLETRNTDARK